MRFSPAWTDAACLGAGGLLFLAFSPWNLVVVAVLSPAVLFRAVWRASPGRAFRRGWLFGVGGFGSGIWWISESFRYRDAGWGTAVSMTALLVGLMALYPGLFGWASARFLRSSGAKPGRRRAAGAALWVLPAAWVLVEWLRGALFSGFTWLQLAYAGLESPLAAYAPVAGSYGVGLAIAITAAPLAMAGAVRLRALLAAAGVAALVWLGSVVLTPLEVHAAWTRPAGEPLRVLIVQGNVPQEEKWAEEARPEALGRYLRLTRDHAAGVDLVVWPETAIPYFAAQVASFLDTVGETAEQGGYAVLTGILTFDPASGKLRNSLARVAAPRAVEPPAYYHKRHLVPFSERLPFEAVSYPIASWLGLPIESFGAGPERQIPLRVGDHEISTSICYEITFGAASARSLGNAGLLVTVSNDAWFGDTAGPHQHLQIARMRALEQGRWLVRAANTGLSALVNPRGEVAVAVPQFETVALEVTVPPLAGETPYTRWRDYPVLALLALMLAVARWRTRRRGKGRVRRLS